MGNWIWGLRGCGRGGYRALWRGMGGCTICRKEGGVRRRRGVVTSSIFRAFVSLPLSGLRAVEIIWLRQGYLCTRKRRLWRNGRNYLSELKNEDRRKRRRSKALDDSQRHSTHQHRPQRDRKARSQSSCTARSGCELPRAVVALWRNERCVRDDFDVCTPGVDCVVEGVEDAVECRVGREEMGISVSKGKTGSGKEYAMVPTSPTRDGQSCIAVVPVTGVLR